MDVLISSSTQCVGERVHKIRGWELIAWTDAWRPVGEVARAKNLASTISLWTKSLTSDVNGRTFFLVQYEALMPIS